MFLHTLFCIVFLYVSEYCVWGKWTVLEVVAHICLLAWCEDIKRHVKLLGWLRDNKALL